MTSAGVTRTLQAGRTQELIHELSVREAMTTAVITVEPENTMEDVRRILKERRVSGLPVMMDGSLVGIVSIEDLIRSLADEDGRDRVAQWMSASPVTLLTNRSSTPCRSSSATATGGSR
jgi:CBS domain-containing protein